MSRELLIGLLFVLIVVGWMALSVTFLIRLAVPNSGVRLWMLLALALTIGGLSAGLAHIENLPPVQIPYCPPNPKDCE